MKMFSMRKSVIMVALAVLMALTGCVRRGPPAFPTEAQLNQLSHTVKAQGETLFAIAAWYTGQGSNWPQLVQANPGLNPNRMRIGEVVKIPKRLALRVDPMPAVKPSSKLTSSGRANDSGAMDSVTTDPVTTEPAAQADQNSVSTPEGFGSTSSAPASTVPAAPSSASSSFGSGFSDTPLDDDFFDAPPVVNPSVKPAPIPATSPAPVPTVAPTVEKRIKSRDELLQELLKDY